MNLTLKDALLIFKIVNLKTVDSIRRLFTILTFTRSIVSRQFSCSVAVKRSLLANVRPDDIGRLDSVMITTAKKTYV